MKFYYKPFFYKLSSAATFTGYICINYYLFKKNVETLERNTNLDYIVF